MQVHCGRKGTQTYCFEKFSVEGDLHQGANYLPEILLEHSQMQYQHHPGDAKQPIQAGHLKRRACPVQVA